MYFRPHRASFITLGRRATCQIAAGESAVFFGSGGAVPTSSDSGTV